MLESDFSCLPRFSVGGKLLVVASALDNNNYKKKSITIIIACTCNPRGFVKSNPVFDTIEVQSV